MAVFACVARREFSNSKLGWLWQGKRLFKIELCVGSSVLQFFRVGKVSFRLIRGNGFHIKEENGRFTRVIVRTSNVKVSRRPLADSSNNCTKEVSHVHDYFSSFVTLSLPSLLLELSSCWRTRRYMSFENKILILFSTPRGFFWGTPVFSSSKPKFYFIGTFCWDCHKKATPEKNRTLKAWPNARKISIIFNATCQCSCVPGPWRARSGPNAHALAQQCCVNAAKRVQHHATSKILHDKFARFQIWSNIIQHVATYRNRVAKRMQHVVPNNVARCCVEMLRALGQALRKTTMLPSGALGAESTTNGFLLHHASCTECLITVARVIYLLFFVFLTVRKNKMTPRIGCKF